MKRSFFWIMLVPLLIISGCFSVEVGSLEKDTIEIIKDKSTELEVILDISMGELYVSKGAEEWVEGIIEYNVESLDPEVNYELIQNRGQVIIKQNDGNFGINIGDVENNWDLKLTNEIPIDLKIDAGVSETELDLRGLKLKNLEVQAGVGDITIDMSGQWEESFNAIISTGVGSSTVILPTDIGVIIEADKGIVAGDFIGLISLGDGVYVNEAYNASNSHHIKIEADLGIGEVVFKVN
ncbi:toast rack family protein [Chengkuizengella marina]|nr:toast rack family protein [Chengkuizengella marina]